MPEVVIKSSESDKRLIFTNKDGEYIRVHFEGPAVHATKVIWLYEDFPSLVGFFQRIATHWKGWDKAIEWNSIEGDLALSATSDHLGHAYLTIVISQFDEHEEWTLSTGLAINTTQADEIINGLKRLR